MTNSRIHQLPDDLIARIAAGEVVERPASVLKELIENSLDAGSTEISIVIEGAGRTRLQISDNGSGMTKDEALLAIRRHCTSKINQLEDLENLASYGFRGEALPSICAVSNFRLVTKARHPRDSQSGISQPVQDSVGRPPIETFEGDEFGWEFQIEGGKIISEKPVAREAGTTIEVRDLFFNTPARFKFLKADFTERAQCLRVVEEMAFASPHVTFHLQIENGKPQVFQREDIQSAEGRLVALDKRVIEAWGNKYAKALVSVQEQDAHFSLYGVVTHPHHHGSSTRDQFLFVNRRPVQNRRLTRAIYDGYMGQLPSQRHPSWVLFLEVDPTSVDVNVHPSKREVKLAHESEIYGFVVSSVRRALQPKLAAVADSTQRMSPAGEEGAAPSIWEIPKPFGATLREAVDTLYKPLSPVLSRLIGDSEQQLDLTGVQFDQLTAIAQLQNVFVIAQSEKGLVVVDQHAAAEKVLYEQLLKNLRGREPEIQMMLVPFTWEVSLSLSGALNARLDAFVKLGFQIEPFGGNTYLVKGYPSILGQRFDLHSLLDGLSDVLFESSDRRGGLENDFDHRLAAMTACKASVKAGDPLDLKACQALLDDLLKCEAPATCPHGRPTTFQMGWDELERKFKR